MVKVNQKGHYLGRRQYYSSSTEGTLKYFYCGFGHQIIDLFIRFKLLGNQTKAIGMIKLHPSDHLRNSLQQISHKTSKRHTHHQMLHFAKSTMHVSLGTQKPTNNMLRLQRTLNPPRPDNPKQINPKFLLKIQNQSPKMP